MIGLAEAAGALWGLLRRPAAWLAITLAFAGLQTWRLHHAKADVATARAALVNPATRHTWRADYERARGDLAACSGSLAGLQREAERQSSAVAEAAAQAAERLAQSRRDLAEADRRRTAAERRAAAILARRPGEDRCASALELLRGH